MLSLAETPGPVLKFFFSFTTGPLFGGSPVVLLVQSVLWGNLLGGIVCCCAQKRGYHLARDALAIRPVHMRALAALFRKTCHLPWENLSIFPPSMHSSWGTAVQMLALFSPPSAAAHTRLLRVRIGARFSIFVWATMIIPLTLRAARALQCLITCDFMPCAKGACLVMSTTLFSTAWFQPVQYSFPHPFQYNCRALVRLYEKLTWPLLYTCNILLRLSVKIWPPLE